MKDCASPFDDEDRVRPGTHGGRLSWPYGLTPQWDDYTFSVAAKLGRLHNYYIVPDRELPFPNGGMVFFWSEDFGRLAL